MKMKRVRDMVRIVTFGDGGRYMCEPPRKVMHHQQDELKEKMAILRMLNPHERIAGVGIRYTYSTYYVELGGEPNVS